MTVSNKPKVVLDRDPGKDIPKLTVWFHYSPSINSLLTKSDNHGTILVPC